MAHIFEVLEDFFSIRDGIFVFIRQYLNLITSNDILILFCIALPLVGLGIGLIRRLVSIRA